MGKRIMVWLVAFVAGAVVTAAPFLITGHLAHLDEAARGEQTMGPGLTTFAGLLAAPLGGIVAVLIVGWLMRRKQTAAKRPGHG